MWVPVRPADDGCVFNMLLCNSSVMHDMSHAKVEHTAVLSYSSYNPYLHLTACNAAVLSAHVSVGAEYERTECTQVHVPP